MSKGLSYLEVLIAAGIALTGILGAVALFPVAVMNLKKGQTVDVSATVGSSALNSVSTLHVDDPKWWKLSVGGTLVDAENAAYPPRGDFQGRRVHAALQPFDALCFDPRYVATVATWNAAQSDPTLFPAIPQANALDARMRRVTLWGGQYVGNTKPAMTSPQARLLFKCQDDLLFERPDDKTAPARQFAIDNGSVQRRDYFADFEYIVTAVPATQFIGGVFVATGEYDVSAVVFRERMPDLSTISTFNGDASFVEEERLCDLTFLTPGYNGGDVTATLRAGRPVSDLACVDTAWALVSGVQTVTDTSTSPSTVGTRPVFQWYRVAAFGDTYPSNNPQNRDLTLDGPDWLPSTSNVRITLLSGVVGVFAKRMTLQ